VCGEELAHACSWLLSGGLVARTCVFSCARCRNVVLASSDVCVLVLVRGVSAEELADARSWLLSGGLVGRSCS
jgi:hypothetical protein